MQSYHSDSDQESPARSFSSSMPAHMNAVPLKLLLPQRHVIDDDKEDSLVIDEKPKKPAKVRPHNQQRGPIKLRLSGSLICLTKKKIIPLDPYWWRNELTVILDSFFFFFLSISRQQDGIPFCRNHRSSRSHGHRNGQRDRCFERRHRSPPSRQFSQPIRILGRARVWPLANIRFNQLFAQEISFGRNSAEEECRAETNLVPSALIFFSFFLFSINWSGNVSAGERAGRHRRRGKPSSGCWRWVEDSQPTPLQIM